MDTIITITWTRAQSLYGYQLSVIRDGEEIFSKDRIGTCAGAAAAEAVKYKARYKAKRIIACKNVMDIINGC